jgi:hypothetical protein
LSQARTVEFLEEAELCGMKDVPKGLHYKSLRPLIDSPGAAWDCPAVTQAQRVRQGGAVRGIAMRTELHRFTMWDEGREGEELFDFSGDPRELKHLATVDKEASLKADLKTRLQTIIAALQT